MSRRPTPTPGGIVGCINSPAFAARLINRIPIHQGVPVEDDRNTIIDIIQRYITSQTKRRNMRTFNGLVTSFGPTYPIHRIDINNIGLTFEYMHELRFLIDFNLLDNSDMDVGAMKGVIFYNQFYPRNEICTLYDLFCYLTKPHESIDMNSPLRRYIMSPTNSAKYDAMIATLTRTFNGGFLRIRTDEQQNISYIIKKAGVPHLPNAMTPSNLNSAGLRLSLPQGGRGRQRRMGRSLLSRKKRNTRMKKSKKYNKSKKIKN